MLFVYLFFSFILRSKKQRLRVISIFIIFSFAFSLHGIFQYSGIDFMHQSSRYVTSDNPSLHVFSIFGNSNLLTSFISLFAGPSIALLLFPKKPLYKIFGFVSLLTIFIAILLSGVRTGLLSITISSFLVIIIYLSKSVSKLFSYAAICLLFIVLIGSFRFFSNPLNDKNRSVSLRSIYMKSCILMIKDSPTGSGNDTFKTRYPDYQAEILKSDEAPYFRLSRLVNMEKPGHPHNEFLYLFVESGPISFILFILILLIPAFRLRKKINSESIIYFSMSSSFVIISLTGFPLMVPITAIVLPIIVGFSESSRFTQDNDSPQKARGLLNPIGILFICSSILIIYSAYAKQISNIHLTEAKVALKNKDHNTMNYHLIESLRYNPANDEALFSAGVLSMEKGKYEEAINYFDRAANTSSDKNLMKNAARSRMLLGEYKSAQDILSRLSAAYPADFDATMMLLDAFLKSGDYISAEKVVLKGLAIYPRSEYLTIIKNKLAVINSGNGSEY